MYRRIAAASIVVTIVLAGCANPGPGAETTPEPGMITTPGDGAVEPTPTPTESLLTPTPTEGMVTPTDGAGETPTANG